MTFKYFNRTDQSSTHGPDGGRAWSPWTWMVLACLLLGGSGGVHAWQDHRFATIQGRVESAPFALKDLPMTLGDDEWGVRDGAQRTLDPEVARVAGCTDSVIRTYTNSTTGVSLTVLILFGPARDVFSHVPEVCYPAAGYALAEAPLLRSVVNGAGPPAEFRTEVFAETARTNGSVRKFITPSDTVTTGRPMRIASGRIFAINLRCSKSKCSVRCLFLSGAK